LLLTLSLFTRSLHSFDTANNTVGHGFDFGDCAVSWEQLWLRKFRYSSAEVVPCYSVHAGSNKDAMPRALYVTKIRTRNVNSCLQKHDEVIVCSVDSGRSMRIAGSPARDSNPA